jgi:anti-anti-sigma factor
MTLKFRLRRLEAKRPLMVLVLDGSVDSLSANRMGTILDLVLDRHHGPLVIDFARVHYVASAGWRELIERIDVLKQQGVHVVGMQPSVSDVFHMIGLDGLIPSHVVMDQALAAIRAQDKTVAPVGA